MSVALRASAGSVFLAIALLFAPHAAGGQMPLPATVDHVPPLLEEGPSPALAYQRLSPEETRRMDEGRRLHIFPETSRKEDGELVLRVQSLGVIDAPTSRVVEVLEEIEAYPSWLVLSPSYKTVRVLPEGRLRLGIGKADREEVKTRALYRVETEGDRATLWSARWLFEEEVRAFQPGSFLHYALQPHPDDPSRTLVLHTQETRIDGWLAKRYLTGETDEGWSRHWEDARKHARRVHWAMAVAASRDSDEVVEEPDLEERTAYTLHHNREFGFYPPLAGKDACRAADARRGIDRSR